MLQEALKMAFLLFLKPRRTLQTSDLPKTMARLHVLQAFLQQLFGITVTLQLFCATLLLYCTIHELRVPVQNKLSWGDFMMPYPLSPLYAQT